MRPERTAPDGPTGWSDDQRSLLAAALDQVNADRLVDRLRSIVDIPSPSGEELALASWLAGELALAGAQGRVQPAGPSPRSANAIGRLGRGDEGATLLLYAPIDTAFSGNADEDRPWLGDDPSPDLRLPASVRDGKVIGLGAENPKSHVAAILEAVTALAATGAGASLPGAVAVGFGAGGMPTSGRPGLPPGIGHGVGARALLEHGLGGTPDMAIIVKPGWSVSWEEVGISWHTVRLRGTRNYTGIRHRIPYRNPIVDAARVIERLEAWLPGWTASQTSGLVAPQGSVGAISAGSANLAAFVPETAEFVVDLRLSPRTTPDAVAADLEAFLAGLRAEDPALDVAAEMTVGIPGTHTDPEHWIVRAAIRAWEAAEGRPHAPAMGGSGATDAAILRGFGIPTARIGPPPARTPSPHGGFSMGVADVEALERLVRLLLRVVVDTVTRPRAELGLAD